MALRLHSTVRSLINSEPTILAIIETLLAVTATVAIAVHADTLIFIAVAACIAPWLLLRTNMSIERSFRWFTKVISVVEKFPIAGKVIYTSYDPPTTREIFFDLFRPLIFWLYWAILAPVALILSSLIIKIIATALTLLTKPLLTLQAIPDNWKRIVLCTDLTTLPELLPGIEEHHRTSAEWQKYPRLAYYSVTYLAGDIFDTGARISLRLLATVYRALFLTVIWSVSVCYRWSLKSTSFIYIFIAWIVNTPVYVKNNLRSHLLSFTDDITGKIVFLISLFVFVASIVKFYLFVFEPAVIVTLSETPGWGKLVVFIAPRQLPNVGPVVDFWHVTSFLGSCIYIYLYLHADKLQNRIVHNQPWSESSAISVFSAGNILRQMMTLYTIPCVVYVTLMSVTPIEWQKLIESIEKYTLRFIPW